MAESDDLRRLQEEYSRVDEAAEVVRPADAVRMADDELDALCDRVESRIAEQEPRVEPCSQALRAIAVPNVKKRRYKKN